MTTGQKVALGVGAYFLWKWWDTHKGPGPCVTREGLPCPPAGRVHGGAICGDPIVGHGKFLIAVNWGAIHSPPIAWSEERARGTALGNTYTGYASQRPFTDQECVDFMAGLSRVDCTRRFEIDQALEQLRFVKGATAEIIKKSPAALFEFARYKTLAGQIIQNGHIIGDLGIVHGDSGSGGILDDAVSWIGEKAAGLADYAWQTIKKEFESALAEAEKQAQGAIDKCAQDPEACAAMI